MNTAALCQIDLYLVMKEWSLLREASSHASLVRSMKYLILSLDNVSLLKQEKVQLILFSTLKSVHLDSILPDKLSMILP